MEINKIHVDKTEETLHIWGDSFIVDTCILLFYLRVVN